MEQQVERVTVIFNFVEKSKNNKVVLRNHEVGSSSLPRGVFFNLIVININFIK